MKAIFIGGVLNGTEFKDVNDVHIIQCIGHTRISAVCREELNNQPIFKGYLEPMWNGDGLRYETQEIYNKMSI